VRLTADDLLREQLSHYECQGGPAVGECDMKPADVAELAEHRFAVAGNRLGADALAVRCEKRAAPEHAGRLGEQLLDNLGRNPREVPSPRTSMWGSVQSESTASPPSGVGRKDTRGVFSTARS
jgi:hypothetical protein